MQIAQQGDGLKGFAQTLPDIHPRQWLVAELTSEIRQPAKLCHLFTRGKLVSQSCFAIHALDLKGLHMPITMHRIATTQRHCVHGLEVCMTAGTPTTRPCPHTLIQVQHTFMHAARARSIQEAFNNHLTNTWQHEHLWLCSGSKLCKSCWLSVFHMRLGKHV